MKTARIHRLGPPDIIVIDDVPRLSAFAGQILVRVANAGVGPWDPLIREGKSVVSSPLPITLGSDLAGVVDTVGPGVTQFKPGDEVYAVTDPQFIGGYSELALASARMIVRKPQSLSFAEAASVPVVAVTGRQMLFDYAMRPKGKVCSSTVRAETWADMQCSSPAKPAYASSPRLHPLIRNTCRSLGRTPWPG